MNRREYRQMFAVEDRHWWYVTLHRLIMRVVERECLRKGLELEILDAGCGTGRLCQLLQSFGRVSGCDISEDALDCCRERGIENLFRADLNDLELPQDHYDVITSIDTLYHNWVVDDAAVVARFRRAIRPGGILILNLVAHEFLRSSHDMAVHTRKRYTRPEVVAMLRNAGFEVELASYRLGLLFPPIALYRLLLRRLTSGRPPEEVHSDVKPLFGMLNCLLTFIAGLENRIIPHMPIPIGTSIFVVGRRI